MDNLMLEQGSTVNLVYETIKKVVILKSNRIEQSLLIYRIQAVRKAFKYKLSHANKRRNDIY